MPPRTPWKTRLRSRAIPAHDRTPAPRAPAFAIRRPAIATIAGARSGALLLAWIGLVAAGVVGAVGCGCEGKRQHVDSLPEMPYPSCGEGELPEGEVLAERYLRSGPTMREQGVMERYTIRRRDCLEVIDVHQEWQLGTADVQVVYDAQGRPVRAWKRMTMAGAGEGDIRVDIRRFELRTQPIGIHLRGPTGRLERLTLRGGQPTVVIGPGRGLVGMWIRRAHLEVGQRVRELALDIREPLEVLREVTLKREPDRQEPTLGRRVRVYTFYGRESVFTDDEGFVIADLWGLRPHESLTTPEPPPQPSPGPPDPLGTP